MAQKRKTRKTENSKLLPAVRNHATIIACFQKQFSQQAEKKKQFNDDMTTQNDVIDDDVIFEKEDFRSGMCVSVSVTDHTCDLEVQTLNGKAKASEKAVTNKASNTTVSVSVKKNDALRHNRKRLFLQSSNKVNCHNSCTSGATSDHGCVKDISYLEEQIEFKKVIDLSASGEEFSSSENKKQSYFRNTVVKGAMSAGSEESIVASLRRDSDYMAQAVSVKPKEENGSERKKRLSLKRRKPVQDDFALASSSQQMLSSNTEVFSLNKHSDHCLVNKGPTRTENKEQSKSSEVKSVLETVRKCELNPKPAQSKSDKDKLSESQTEMDSEQSQDVEESLDDQKSIYSVPYYLDNFNVVIRSVLDDDYNISLFDESDLKYVESYYKLSEPSQKLFVRLFSRKLAWLPLSKIKYPQIALDLTPLLAELVACGLLLSGESLDNLAQVLSVLPAPDLRSLAKSYHLNAAGQHRKQIIQALISISQQNTVASFFGQKIGGVQTAMIKRAKQIAGPVCQLQKEARAVFVRALMLSSLVSTIGDEESGNGGQGQLFQLLLVNMGRVVYPVYSINRQTHIFRYRQDLIRFEKALQLESEFQSCTSSGNWSGAYATFIVVQECYEGVQKDQQILDWDSQLPDFLRQYTAGSVLVRLLSGSIEVLQRRKDYAAAVALIRSLLAQAVYCPDHRGYWWDRLALNLDAHLKQQTLALEAIQDGLADPCVRTGHRLSLYLRAQSICNKPKSEFKNRLKEFSHEPLLELPKSHVEGQVLAHELPGSRYQFLTKTLNGELNTEEVTLCNVEHIVLAHYCCNGYPQGIHAEGSIVSTLFCLYFWEHLFADIPDAFHSPFQTAPLDFYSDCFCQQRQKQIFNRLKSIEESTKESLMAEMAETWNKQKGVMCVGINWDSSATLEELQGLVSCMGGRVLAGILRRFAQQPRHTRGGFPDLTLWNVEKQCLKICEVKGPGDRLSHKQMLWLDYLLKLGVDAEVCHVKPVAAKRLKPTQL